MIKIEKIYKFVLLKILFLFTISLLIIKVNKFNYGIDFRSGSVIEFEQKFDNVIKNKLDNLSKKNNINFLYEESLDFFKVKFSNSNIKTEEILEQLKLENIKVRKFNNISPSFSKAIYIKALKAIFASFVMIFLYILFNFNFKFSIIAVLSIFINIIFLLSLISLLKFEFNFSIITALLIIIGYCINDIIILYDRIRTSVRNFNIINKCDNINQSLSSVLKRTIITSALTLISSISLIFIKDQIITQFAIIVSIGILIGTCFSIFLVTSLIIIANIDLKTLLIKEKTSNFYNS